MIDLIEVFDRAETGPLISETDYYMKRYVPKLSEVIARHKVKWDKQTIINTDDTLTDAVFEAAVDLIAEAGAYCPETNRVMQFSRDEIDKRVKAFVAQTKVFERADELKAALEASLGDFRARRSVKRAPEAEVFADGEGGFHRVVVAEIVR
ncbi:MAG TPA: monomethylamine:corrinoid methyltransferase [Thermoleophilia bacterium]|nr:monomethylamine:corrinoid methyltransferase [Thermoleophilia bacterium]